MLEPAPIIKNTTVHTDKKVNATIQPTANDEDLHQLLENVKYPKGSKVSLSLGWDYHNTSYAESINLVPLPLVGHQSANLFIRV